MRNTIRNLAATAMAGGLVVATAPAGLASSNPEDSASPLDCEMIEHQVFPDNGMVSYCGVGQGEHRIAVRCNEGELYGGFDYYVYGDWVSAGEYSVASCFLDATSGFYRGAHIQTRT